MANLSLIFRRSVTLLAVIAAACAPHDFGPESGFDGWANMLGEACYPNSIGGVQLRQLFYQAAFIDLASRLYYGKINTQQFTGMVNDFYPGPNRAAIDCMVSRLPKKPGAT